MTDYNGPKNPFDEFAEYKCDREPWTNEEWTLHLVTAVCLLFAVIVTILMIAGGA